MNFFEKDTKTAMEAIKSAQWIAFAPIVFQASLALRDLGILEALEAAKTDGLTLAQIVEKTKLPEYGARVLVEAGLGIGLLTLNNGVYHMTKTGYLSYLYVFF